MKISIIIPYTTGLILLQDCLESLKQQTFREFEVILVQDQIPEEVNEEGNITWIEEPDSLLIEYRQAYPIEYINPKKHLGVAGCRNLGIEKASGEYIYFLDMDDYLMPDTLSLLMEKANEESYDGIYGERLSTWYKRKVFLETLKEQEEQGSVILKAAEEEKNTVDGSRDEADDDDAELKFNTISLGEGLSDLIQRLFVQRRGLLGISALHLLMRKEIIDASHLRFDEELPLYSDLVFMTQFVTKISNVCFVPEAYYIKRKRNNPVQYPAMCQIKSENKFGWYILAYKKAMENLKEFPMVEEIIEQKLMNYYTHVFAPKLRRSEKEYWKKERFVVMQELAKQWNPELIAKQSGYKKRLIHALQKGKQGKSLFWVNLHLGTKKAKKLLHNKRLLSTYLYFHYFSKMSIKSNYVMCETFLGRNYADSPKNIFEYMSQSEPGKYQFIWSVDKKTKFPYPCKVVKRFGIRYAYYLARSKYFVFNMRQPMWMRKREGQVFLQTWHGTPLKKLVYDQEEVCSATPLYKQQVYKQSRQWDYLISDNAFSTKVFRSAFLYDKEILEMGYPRNDLLSSPEKEEKARQIKERLKLPKDKKVILYAPTWRDDEYYDKGQYKFALHMDLARYQKELGKEYILLLRTHYFIADQLDLSGYPEFAYNVSKYDDITELYLISDVCITDYSSVFFDFANLKRPILFYTYDLEKYRDILRGFYLDIEKEVPGPLLFNDDEVIHALLNLSQIEKQYQTVYEEFYQRFCSLDDGNASKRIVERVFES